MYVYIKYKDLIWIYKRKTTCLNNGEKTWTSQKGDEHSQKVHHKRGKPVANKHMIIIDLKEMQSEIHSGIPLHTHQHDLNETLTALGVHVGVWSR